MQNLKKFDLNIDTILENWNKSHALRELIANALDEHFLQNINENITIDHDEKNNILTICDYGRGIKPEHFTQNENNEKLSNMNVIGKFGIGLKDAIATLFRNKSNVDIVSKYGKVTFNKISKNDFKHIETLHAIINNDVTIESGTTISITNITCTDLKEAKLFFLKFNNLKLLETNKYGEIYEKDNELSSYIFINGIKVSTEDNFKFHYNITNITDKIRKELNRERNNVGKQLYSERVKQIITNCKSKYVIDMFNNDVKNKNDGNSCDEINYNDVILFLIRSNPSTDIVYMTKTDMENKFHLIDEIKANGKEIILIPENINNKINNDTYVNIDNMPILTTDQFVKQQNTSIVYNFINIENLTQYEKNIYQLTDKILKMAGFDRKWNIKITETINIDEYGYTILGLFNGKDIIIKRCQLSNLQKYAGTLIHEHIHAQYGHDDVSREFESDLTNTIGYIISKSDI